VLRARGELAVLDVSGVALAADADENILQLEMGIGALLTALMTRTNVSEEILKHVTRAHGESLREIRYHEDLRHPS